MKYLLLSIFFCPFIYAKNTVPEKTYYGSEFSSEMVQSISSVINKYDNFKNKDVIVSAKVEKVCEKKGCWMTIKLPKDTARVKFKDYDFFVPLSLKGKDVLLKGQLKRKKVSVKDQKHYLKDAKASKDQISAIKTAKYEFQFIASGVKLKN